MKILRKLRPWTSLTNLSGIGGQSQLEDSEPTTIAEAQTMMVKMKKEALLRVEKDGTGTR